MNKGYDKELLKAFNAFADQFLQKQDLLPVTISFNKQEFSKLPLTQDRGIDALNCFLHKYQHFFPASVGNKFFGYVVGASTPAALIGDWLTSLLDGLDVTELSTHIENETIEMFKQLLSIQDNQQGAFVSGATVANNIGLLLARQWYGNILNIDIARDGLQSLPVIKTFCARPHSSIYKSLSVAGLGRQSLVQIKSQNNRERIDIHDLELHLMQNQFSIVIASAGTVNTGDFDEIEKIIELKSNYKFWLHTDAAFGAFAKLSANEKHLIEAFDFSDSITIDTHKWLNVPYDSAIFFTTHRHLQNQVYQNSNSPYLNADSDDFINLVPENSRRVRAISTWLTLQTYGREGYQRIVETDIRLAKLLGELISTSNEFELLSDVHLNIVCFTLRDYHEQNVIDFLKRLNSTGKVFMTGTVYNGKNAIRAALCNYKTIEKDIFETFEIMKSVVFRNPM
jgi:glutamate/tyrosine decarboxylase-like PLP-dependent enzyme